MWDRKGLFFNATIKLNFMTFLLSNIYKKCVQCLDNKCICGIKSFQHRFNCLCCIFQRHLKKTASITKTHGPWNRMQFDLISQCHVNGNKQTPYLLEQIRCWDICFNFQAPATFIHFEIPYYAASRRISKIKLFLYGLDTI